MDYDDESTRTVRTDRLEIHFLYALTGTVVVTSFIRELGAFEK
jgi:hypothetical protein